MRPARSVIVVAAPASAEMSAVVPTARMRPPLIASASTMAKPASTVRIWPLINIWSGESEFCGTSREHEEVNKTSKRVPAKCQLVRMFRLRGGFRQLKPAQLRRQAPTIEGTVMYRRCRTIFRWLVVDSSGRSTSRRYAIDACKAAPFRHAIG